MLRRPDIQPGIGCVECAKMADIEIRDVQLRARRRFHPIRVVRLIDLQLVEYRGTADGGVRATVESNDIIIVRERPAVRPVLGDIHRATISVEGFAQINREIPVDIEVLRAAGFYIVCSINIDMVEIRAGTRKAEIAAAG